MHRIGYAQVSAVMRKTLLASEAACGSQLVEMASVYRVVKRSDMIASLRAPSLAPGGGTKEIETAHESTVSFSC